MWPFRSKPGTDAQETPPVASYAHRLDTVELDLIEIRDTQEKVLVAIKKVQGRLLKRVQVAEAALADGEVPDSSSEAVQPDLPLGPRSKADLRHRANALRGINVNGR